MAESAASISTLLLRLFAVRHWRSAPGQSLLLVLILALGIAVFFSIRLANRAAVASFQNFTDLITQESDWLIQAPVGRLPEQVLVEVREQLGDAAITIVPVLETTGARPSTDPDEPIGARETFQIVGIDLIGTQNLAAERAQSHSWFRDPGESSSPEGGGKRFWEVFRNPRAVFISRALAERDSLRPGGMFDLVINEQVVKLEVAGVIPVGEGVPRAPATLLVMDLPSVQQWSGQTGWLSRIEFSVAPGADEASRRAELKEQLEEWSAGRWLVSSPSERRESAATMTRAFRLNLTILSLLALLVGLYLIFQALDGAVVRRREEIGILRSLGVEERSIRRVWLWEAACLGLAGGVAGALLGWMGAQFSVRLVSRTVNALYYSSSAEHAHMDVRELLAALLLAVCASLLAGWLPARSAARTPPAQILARHPATAAGLRLWRHESLGALLFLAGFGLVLLPPVRLDEGGRFPLAGYLAALCWVLGGGLLAGWVLRHSGRLLRKAGSVWMTVRIAASHVTQPSGRHRLAVAGLVCAVAMTSGMAILVSSFDATMRGWIERAFQADLYISSSGAQSASSENRIAPETWRSLGADGAVAAINVFQAREIQLPEGRVMFSGADLALFRDRASLAWMQAPGDDAIYDPARNAGLALVSESFSERFRVRQGDRITVPVGAGERPLRVAGVFSDYGNERGSILVDRVHFAEWLGDEQASGLVVWLRSGAAVEEVRAEWLERYPGLRIFSQSHLRSEILRVFRQTFAITYALEVVGVIVAVAGLGLTLGSVLLERRNELTTLRALGLRREEIARATACEGLILALAGVVVGTGVSLLLGWLLIFVINKQTFGWTLGWRLPWVQMAVLGTLVTAMGAAVAWGVGRWGACLPADREE
jgi:putative ABC transport system permease protein